MNYAAWVVAETPEFQLWENNLGHYQLRKLVDGSYKGESLYLGHYDDTDRIEVELENATDTSVWLALWVRDYAHCFER